MDINPTTIAALLGLLGIVIAALFSSVGYFLKTRLEAKKSTRKVLYWLLEIHHAIKTLRLDPTELTQEVLQRFRNKMMERGIPCPSDEELLSELRTNESILEYYKKIIDLVRTDLNERFLDPYEKALLELAQVDPFLTYRLGGKEKLTAYVQLANQYSRDFSELVRSEVSTDHSRESIVSLGDRSMKQAIDHLVQELEQDILKVARRSGGKDLKQCRTLIADTYTSKQFDFSKLDPLLEEVFSMYDGTPPK